jgi:hypothetical protein
MASACTGTRSGFPTTSLVRGSIRTTVLEASSTQRTPSVTVTLPAPGRGMTAANRPRSKAGTMTPVPVGVGGGWVDRGVLRVSATSAHAAAASSTATTSVLCQRGARSGDGRRVAGLAWPTSPPRAPEWSILPTPDAPGRFLEPNKASRIRRRGNRPGKRKFANMLETHTGRGLVGSSVVRKLQRPARPIRRRDRLHPGLRAELLVFAQITQV